MRPLIQPKRLASGEKIATVSPCHGWAGDVETKWKYDLGVSRLQELGLQVVAAPNSLRGSAYLSQNPAARADDLQWAFENKEIRAIVANVGGNDSMHPIADPSGWHAYSKKWFLKTLFDASPIGPIDPSPDWTFEPSDPVHREKKRAYSPNSGYELIQGKGVATGRLIGGHTGILELEGTCIALTPEEYEGAILFIEDIPEFFDEKGVCVFFAYLGQKGILQRLNGIILGKANENCSFSGRAQVRLKS